jgi:chromosome segregation ATPase
MVGCNTAQDDFDRCQKLHAQGDLSGAKAACSAAVAKDPNSKAGKAAAAQLVDWDRQVEWQLNDLSDQLDATNRKLRDLNRSLDSATTPARKAEIQAQIDATTKKQAELQAQLEIEKHGGDVSAVKKTLPIPSGAHTQRCHMIDGTKVATCLPTDSLCSCD